MVAWELVLVFLLLLALHFVPGPSFPLFSLNALQLPGPFSCGWVRYPSCFTSFTLLLHYLQEWTEVIGTSLVCARRR